MIDLEPVKHIWLQVTHTPGLGLAVDPLAAPNFGATGSLPGAVGSFVVDPIHTVFFWNMFPNPPWEDFRLLVVGPGEIDQIVVDTAFPRAVDVCARRNRAAAPGCYVRRRRRRAGHAA